MEAQESNSLYFMKGMPQANMYNPVLHNDSSTVVIGLPGLSGMYFDLNGDVAINDVIHYGTDNMSDSLIVDIDRFHSALTDQNYFSQNFNTNLFHLGFRTDKVFFDFSVTEKQFFSMEIGKDFVSFLKDGNVNYIGKTQNFRDIDMDFMHYREFAIGASTDVMDGRLSVGIRAKALYGKFAMQTGKLNFQVTTAGDGSSLMLNTDMKVNFALPTMTPDYDENNLFTGFSGDFKMSDYMLASDYMGMAFDLGAVFKVNPKLTVSASLVDIGKIAFDTDAYNVYLNDSYAWEGLDFSDSPYNEYRFSCISSYPKLSCRRRIENYFFIFHPGVT